MASRKIGGNKIPPRNPHFSAKESQQNINIPRKGLTFWRDERQSLLKHTKSCNLQQLQRLQLETGTKKHKEKNLLYLWKEKRQRSPTKVSFRCNVRTSAANNGNCYSPKLKMKLYLFFHGFFPILGNKMKR
jgi:hypothetical protein